MVGAPYPATKLRSPRAYDIVLSIVGQHQMRHEKTVLPLAGKQNHGGTTAPPSTLHTLPGHHVA
jgi:hypothetical protein